MEVSLSYVQEHHLFQAVAVQMILDIVWKHFAYTDATTLIGPQALGGMPGGKMGTQTVRRAHTFAPCCGGRQKAGLTLGLLQLVFPVMTNTTIR